MAGIKGGGEGQNDENYSKWDKIITYWGAVGTWKFPLTL